MAKYGVFVVGGSKALNEVEGDYMTQGTEKSVQIFRRARPDDVDGTDKLAATIHLAPGQFVKEIQ